MATLKQELMIWAEALDAYDAENFQLALKKFEIIAETSRIEFNLGIIRASLGEHEEAIPHFQRACDKDTFLAVAFFQLGVSHFLLGQFEAALGAFSEAESTMRGNLVLDYEQIGLKFRLYSCEIAFNKGLCFIYVGREQDGMRFLEDASRDKQTQEHGVIDEARRDRGTGYNVFSIPAGVLYRPPDSKLRNLQAKNYLGQARLVAATDPQDAFVTFTGVTKQRAQEQMASQPQPQSQRKGPVSTGLDPLPENTTVQRSITRSASANATGGGSAPQRSNTMAATSSGAGLRRRPSDYSAAITQSKPPPMPPVPEKTQAPFQPVQSLGRKESNTGLPGPAFKPVLGGSKPLDTPPESGNMEASYAEQQDLLNAYADPRDSTERIQDLVFEPPSEDRKPMGQTSDRIRDWAANTSKVAGRGPPPPASSVYPQTPGRNMSLSRKGSAAGSIPPPVPQPLNLRKNRAGQASVEDGADSFGMEGSSIQSWRDVERIRVKLHYNSTIRGMIISPDLPYEAMVDLVCRKLNQDDVRMQFEDTDGSRIEVIDEGDWDAALDSSREQANGRPDAKLQIYITE